MSAMTGIIARRELAAYFATPLAYVNAPPSIRKMSTNT